MVDIGTKAARKFLEASGVKLVEDMVPFIHKLAEGLEGDFTEEGYFDAENIEITLLEWDFFGEGRPDVSGIIRWLSDLSIIRRKRTSDVGKALFSFDPAIAHALTLVNAD